MEWPAEAVHMTTLCLPSHRTLVGGDLVRNGQLSAVTAGYSVPGCKYLDVITTVNVDGSQTYRDYVQDTHNMTWNPTVGNC